MKKTGPCRDCGIETTPLWRNGPEGKPVLCNACGSRYKLCGHLNGYMPRHFHSGLRKNLQNFNDAGNSNVEDKPPSAHNLPTSGRRILSFWDNIPSRKRSRVVYEKITPMMKFRNELYKLWRVYGNPNEEEEVLLDQNLTNNFIPSNEIGLGAMILKPHDDDAPPPPKKPCNN